MAVERIKEFTIELGDLIETRLDSFVNAKKRIQATVEAEFQRNITDNDLSWQEQLDYRQQQLKEEKEKTYPDNEFIDEIKGSITGLKKLVRARKYRDKYFDILEGLASGKKSLEDHLTFLEGQYQLAWDEDIRDQIQEQIVKVKAEKRQADKGIIDSQITFYQTDRTSDSLDKAINLVKEQLNKPEVQRDNTIRGSYELQLRTLEKERLEIDTEDKLTWIAIDSIRTEKDTPSIWKVETFAGFRDKASAEIPISVGEVRYNSEREYWEAVLNDYIQNDFAKDFATENKNKTITTYNQFGLLPSSYLNNLVSKFQTIESNPDLSLFSQTLTTAIQASVSDFLDYKSKEISATYHLDTEFAITTDYKKGIKELENLQTTLGNYYSLTPEIQAVQTKLMKYNYNLAGEIQKTAVDYIQDYASTEGVSYEEAEKTLGGLPAVIDIIGRVAEIEIPPVTYLEKAPTEIAKEEIEAGEQIPVLQERVKTLTEQITETQKRIKEEQERRGITPTPTPTPTPPPPPAPTPPPPTPPAAAPPPVPPTPQIPYTVKGGETLWGIAQEQLGSGARWKELKTPEGVEFTEETARRLQIGQKLIIPPK